MISKIKKLALRHKIITGFIILLIIFAGYFTYQSLKGNNNAVSYVSATVQKGTIIVSVSGTGQVSASDQLDIKAKASGDVIYVGAQNGQEVKEGQLLLKLDTQQVQETINNAQITFDQAKTTLEKMQGLQTAAGTLRSTKQIAMDNLAKAYDDGFNTVSNAFLDLPNVMSGLNDIFFGYTFTKNQQNINWYVDQVSNLEGGSKAIDYRNDLNSSYLSTKEKYDQNFNDYKATSRNSDTATIESLISESYDTTKMISDTLKKAVNYLSFVSDMMKKSNISIPSSFTTYQSNLNSYTGTTNNYLASLLSAKNTIQSDKESLIETDFDLADQQTKVQQAQQALNDAQDNLANYYVYAPFDGTVAEFNFKKGDTASNGATVATLVSQEQLANITLNEVDIVKVKIGQQANITFDAIPDLTIAGKVVEIDTIGTVSQGVVTYGVQVGFQTQDTRVRPSMSASVSIITDVAQDVLVVSNSAVKQQGNVSYVDILTASSSVPQEQVVTTGLSDDTMTEIVSGLNEGDEVVTQTVASSASQSSQSRSTTNANSNSGLRILGGFGR